MGNLFHLSSVLFGKVLIHSFQKAKIGQSGNGLSIKCRRIAFRERTLRRKRIAGINDALCKRGVVNTNEFLHSCLVRPQRSKQLFFKKGKCLICVFLSHHCHFHQ